MERKIYGVFVAGGSGTRMGGPVPKQFMELDGIPVLQRTIERFVEAVPDLKVITVLPQMHVERWKELCEIHHFDCPQRFVPGGMTRFHSVKNALKAIPDGAVVMIHDGVRPLVSVSMVRRMLDAMDENRAVIPFTPVTDTLKSREPGCPAPDRSALMAVQTPQIFRSEDIRAAYSLAYDPSFTDDSSVAEKAGIPLSFVEGERYNIKITTPEDVPVALSLLRI